MLLVLPANVRLDWKVIFRCKHYSLFGLFISNEEKSFITLGTGANVIKTFFFVTYEEAKSIRLSRAQYS
jgi:hypothetical protein